MRYLYSDANVYGSVAALCGLGLLFGGVIDRGWLLIVAGLYALGASVAPRPRSSGVALDVGLSSSDIIARLDQLLRAVGDSVHAEAQKLLQTLRETVAELLPVLDEAVAANPQAADADAVQLRDAVCRYLPETLDAYLRLPKLYRRYHVLRAGKTAEQLLVEQLRLIERQVHDIGARVYRAQAQALLVQGRFLDQKFARTAEFQAVPTPSEPG